MSIDWEKGKITDEQHLLSFEQLTPMVKNMVGGEIGYIETDALSASEVGALWLDPDANVYSEEEAEDLKDELYFCRIVKLEEGFVIDASTGDFILHPESEDTVNVHVGFDFEKSSWPPVVGVIEDDLQRTEFGRILFEQYDIMLGRSVLMPALESELDEGSGGEGSVA